MNLHCFKEVCPIFKTSILRTKPEIVWVLVLCVQAYARANSSVMIGKFVKQTKVTLIVERAVEYVFRNINNRVVLFPNVAAILLNSFVHTIGAPLKNSDPSQAVIQFLVHQLPTPIFAKLQDFTLGKKAQPVILLKCIIQINHKNIK